MAIEDLPTLGDLQTTPRALRKDQLDTKLDRAIANKAERLHDLRKLRQWAFDVKVRDHWTDRKTKRRVVRTLSLDADRAEAHHIEPKANPVTRYDLRNGICLSLATHLAIELGKFTIEGTAWFRGSDGCRYIDGRFPVIFVRT